MVQIHKKSNITMRTIFISFLLMIATGVLAKSYKGAEIYSNDSWKYGKIEMRMKMVKGSGILSTFFTYKNGSELSGEFWEEIDLEVFGKNNATTFQSNIITNNPKRYSEEVHNTGFSMADEYHTYTLEWTPNYVAWYIDGKELRKTQTQQVSELTSKQSLRFNLWAADIVEWVGTFDTSVLPVYQFVNWVKYSAYTPGKGDNGTDFTLDWTDDFNTFNTNRWSKANWTFGENMTDFDPNNVLVKDGYLVLALTREGQTGFSGTVPVDKITDPIPTVSIKSPSANAAFCSGDVITITADASVSSGSISKVDFFDGDKLIGTDDTSPYSYSWTSATAGTKTIGAIATSNANITSQLSTVNITINDLPQPPTVTSPVVYTQNSTAVALVANGTNLQWYSSASDETASATAPIPSTATVGNTSYFVTQTVLSCESLKEEIIVSVNPEKRKIPLHEGWNLIGCPFSGQTSIETAFSSIWEHVLVIKDMDYFYLKDQADLNTLKNLDWGKGYFIRVDADCELEW